MSISITLAQVDQTGTLLRLRATDPAQPWSGAPGGLPQSITAIDTTKTIVVTVAGTPHSYPLTTLGTTLIHGLNDANSPGYWPGVVLVLTSNSGPTVTSLQAVTIDLPAGWCRMGGIPAPAQSGLAVTNCIAAGSMLTPVTGSSAMKIGDQIIAPYYASTRSTPRNLLLGMFDWIPNTGGVSPTLDTSGPNGTSLGFLRAFNGGATFATCNCFENYPNYGPSGPYTSPSNYPNLAPTGHIKIDWTCASGDATGVPFTSGGVGPLLVSIQGDTFTPNLGLSTLTGTSRRLYLDYTTASGFAGPAFDLQCNSTTITALKAYPVVTINGSEVDPNGNDIWDPIFIQEVTGKYALRWMNADWICYQQGAIDSSDESLLTQVSLGMNNLNPTFFNPLTIGAHANTDGGIDPTTGVPLVVATGVGGSAAAHGYRESQIVLFNGMDGNGTPAFPMAVWRPSIGRPFGDAISFPGTGTGATCSLLNAGTNAALQFTGDFTIEFKFQLLSLTNASGATFCAQAISATQSSYRFQCYLDSSNQINFVVWTDAFGSSVSFHTPPITDLNKHDFAVNTYAPSSHLIGWIDGNIVADCGYAGLRAPGGTVAPLTIGALSDETSPLGVIIDEFRFSDFSRIGNANYTPATVPLVSDTNTVLLYHMDSANGSNVTPDSGPNNLGGQLQGGTLPTLITSPWYVAPGSPSNIGGIYLNNGEKADYPVHVVDSTHFAFAATVSTSYQGSSVATQAGDYISTDAGGATGHPYTVYANETGGGHAFTSWFSRNNIPIQAKIDACNKAGSHLYLNVAIGATDAYMQYLMTAISDPVTGLKPVLLCLFEFGNETWNGIFDHTPWMRSAANLAITGGNSQGFVTNDISVAAQQWYTWRAHQLWTVGVAKLTALATGYPASNLKLLIGAQFVTDPTVYLQPRLDYASANGFLTDVHAAVIAPYFANGPQDHAFDAFFGGATQAQIMSVTQAWNYDNYATFVTYTVYSYLQSRYGVNAPRLSFYEGGMQQMELSLSTGIGPTAAMSRAIARDPQIYDVLQNLFKQWDPYVEFFTHFDLDQAPFVSDTTAGLAAGSPSLMWGTMTSYKDNRGRGDGVTDGSLFNNRSAPQRVDEIEAVAALAMSDWNTLGGGGGGSPGSSGFLSLDWFGLLGD